MQRLDCIGPAPLPPQSIATDQGDRGNRAFRLVLLFEQVMRFRWWARLVRVVAPLGALLVEGWPALIGALLVQEGGLWLTRRLSGKCQTTLGSRLFLLAY